MIKIEKYNPEFEKNWNEFVANSKNGTFLFNRNYMDYHADRFADNSLIFLEEGNLVALLPANLKDSTLYSHQGLTYGGLIIDSKMRISLMLNIFDELLCYLRQNHITQFIYKTIPQFYSSQPAQEDLYALFKNGAQLFRRDISSVVNIKDKIRFSELRRRMIKKAQAQNLEVKESEEFKKFFDLLETNLQSKHMVHAVHSAPEIEKLSKSFPQNIKLYACFKDDEMLAATWVFINKNAIHLQYITSSETGREIGALDLVIDHLLNQKFLDWNYFDFGISTKDDGKFLNEGLIAQKEMFGGRAYCYDQYLLQL